MANIKKIVPDNVQGNFFVDTTCINCDACRKISDNFADNGNYSYIHSQPKTKEEIFKAQQALLTCPTGSIGMSEKLPLIEAKDSFPMPLKENIYLCGSNSKHSYGADSYFITSEMGNWLIDSPRFNKQLAKKMEKMGGIKYIFLGHRDDVADAHKYAEFFKAKRIIHKYELDAQPEAEIILTCEEDHFYDDARIIFTPGHTKGHCVLLWQDKYLFTGDHFAWQRKLNDFGSFKNYCWYDWELQKSSIKKLEVHKNIEALFPGHGRKADIEKGHFPSIIQRAYSKM